MGISSTGRGAEANGTGLGVDLAAGRAAAGLRGKRALVERVLDASRHLDAADRALVEAVLDRGVPVKTLARAAGVPTRQLQRRAERLVTRLADPIVLFVRRRRDDWPAERRAVADAVFLRGLSLRAAAAETKVSLHRVRRQVDEIRWGFEERGGGMREERGERRDER